MIFTEPSFAVRFPLLTRHIQQVQVHHHHQQTGFCAARIRWHDARARAYRGAGICAARPRRPAGGEVGGQGFVPHGPGGRAAGDAGIWPRSRLRPFYSAPVGKSGPRRKTFSEDSHAFPSRTVREVPILTFHFLEAFASGPNLNIPMFSL